MSVRYYKHIGPLQPSKQPHLLKAGSGSLNWRGFLRQCAYEAFGSCHGKGRKSYPSPGSSVSPQGHRATWRGFQQRQPPPNLYQAENLLVYLGGFFPDRMIHRILSCDSNILLPGLPVMSFLCLIPRQNQPIQMFWITGKFCLAAALNLRCRPSTGPE